MREDDVLIKLIESVKKYPSLYDHTSTDYCNVNLKIKNWRKISAEVNMPAMVCKEKWRNIRGRYLRHLRDALRCRSVRKKQKSYYLAEYLDFIRPFTCSRIINNITQVANEASDSVAGEAETEDEHDYKDFDCINYTVSETLSTVLESNKANVLENKIQNEFYKTERVTADGDADMEFLKSLWPDLKSLTPETKRKVKIEILRLIDKACTFNATTSADPLELGEVSMQNATINSTI